MKISGIHEPNNMGNTAYFNASLFPKIGMSVSVKSEFEQFEPYFRQTKFEKLCSINRLEITVLEKMLNLIGTRFANLSFQYKCLLFII